MIVKMNSVKDESVDIMEDGDGLSGESENDDDGCPSSPGSNYDDSTDLITVAMSDEVTAQLAAAGTDRFRLNFLISKIVFSYISNSIF